MKKGFIYGIFVPAIIMTSLKEGIRNLFLSRSANPALSPDQKPPQEPHFFNRATRRRSSSSGKNSEISSLNSELAQLNTRLQETYDDWIRIDKQNGGEPWGQGGLAKIVYQGEPFIYTYLETRHGIPQLIKRIQKIQQNISGNQSAYAENLANLKNQDVFSHKIKGVSLNDIEQMPLPLERDNIKRINRVFHTVFSPGKNQSFVMRYALLCLATQKIARPEKQIAIPASLERLYNRIIHYLDYYVDFFTTSSPTQEEQERFLIALGWAGRWLIYTLGCYLPARLGLTPSSVIKLYQQQTTNVSSILRHVIIHEMEKQTKFSFRKDSLPADIVDYQHYNSQNDKIAAQLLVDFYEKQDLKDVEIASASTDSEQLLERLEGYRKAIRAEIMNSHNNRLTLNFSPNNVINEVIITNQRQNKQTLIFILKFKDKQAHLTLEIDDKNRLYGLPGELIKENPHIGDSILRDILVPFLEKMRLKHPDIETKPISPSELFSKPLILSQSPVSVKEVEEVDIEPVKNPRRVSRIPTSIGRVFTQAQEPEPPSPISEKPRQFRVIHSRKRVAEMLRGTPRSQDIAQIMEAIRKFEFGQKLSKQISWSRGTRVVLRVGDWRIILNPIGKNFYTLETVGQRKDVYGRGRYSDNL